MKKVFKCINLCSVFFMTMLILFSSNVSVLANSNNEVKLRKIIDKDHPVYTIKAYAQDDIIAMWETVPMEMRDSVVIVIQNDDITENNPKIKKYYNLQAERIEEGRKTPIYYFLQALNGETRQSQQISIEYWESLISNPNYNHFLGLNAAELYNSADWYGGDSDGNHSYYLSELMNLCSENGMYFLWMDTNRDQDNSTPMVNRWLENRKHDGGSTIYPVGSMSP